MSQLKEFIPILKWLPKYNQEVFKGDLVAGITVGVMLIPQGMAYAMLAGLSPIYGLYASIVPLIIYAILGTSRQLAVGPVAMISLLIASGIGAIAVDDPSLYLSLAILLSFLVGGILLLMGLFRLGFLVNFLSHPVVSGFTSAAALIIGLSQLKYLLGLEIPRSHHITDILAYTIQHFADISWPTFLIGITAILIIAGVRKFKWPIPGPLLAVAFGIVTMWLMQGTDLGIKIVGAVPKGLPAFEIPDFNIADIKQLLPTALTIALIGFMESIAVAKAIQSKRKNYQISPNQELIALGMANMAGSFFQSFPTTGGFSRTAVNDQTGANTGMASIISAALIALTLLFLTPLFYFLPKAILASVIMIAVYGLIDFQEIKYLWKVDRGDFWMLLITFFTTLLVGIEMGIIVGMILSLILIIFQTSQPHIAELGKIPNQTQYRNIDRFDDLEIRKDLLIIRFDAPLSFVNIAAFRDHFYQKIETKGSTLKSIVFDASAMNRIDSSGLHFLKDIIIDCNNNNITFFISGLKGPLRDRFYQDDKIKDALIDEQFLCIQDAVDFYDKKTKDSSRNHKYLTQVNH